MCNWAYFQLLVIESNELHCLFEKYIFGLPGVTYIFFSYIWDGLGPQISLKYFLNIYDETQKHLIKYYIE